MEEKRCGRRDADRRDRDGRAPQAVKFRRIAASEAKARFSEILERVRRGEGFAITLYGEEVAKLVPARGLNLGAAKASIREIKSRRITLNPPGKARLRIKDLINNGGT